MKDEIEVLADHAKKTEMNLIDENGVVVKTLSRKLLDTMTVSALKAMLAKFFKVEVLNQSITYQALDDVEPLPIDNDLKQLSFFGFSEGGKLYVKSV